MANTVNQNDTSDAAVRGGSMAVIKLRILDDEELTGQAKLVLAREKRDDYRMRGFTAEVIQYGFGWVSVVTSEKFKASYEGRKWQQP